MTHDELLAKIDDEISNCLGLMAGAILGDALISVVKLHKPRGANPMWCGECASFDNEPCLYPCPTIEAIEKELK